MGNVSLGSSTWVQGANHRFLAGSMVIPTTYMALHDPDVYENPDDFDPERYYSGDAEVKGAKNYLVFGTGPHYCLGQVYAQLNLALFVGKASCQLNWKHHATPLSEEIKVFATIFPKVSLRRFRPDKGKS